MAEDVVYETVMLLRVFTYSEPGTDYSFNEMLSDVAGGTSIGVIADMSVKAMSDGDAALILHEIGVSGFHDNDHTVIAGFEPGLHFV